MLADARTGKNGRHALVGLLRQSVFGRLAGYEDVNDAERLRHDPAMRWIVGGKMAQGQGRAASPSQMGRFETQWLAAPENLSALSDLSGQWIDLVYGRRAPRGIVFDIPAVGTVHVARAQSTAFQITELVEHEQRMIAGAGVVTVPDAHLLLDVGRAGPHSAAARARPPSLGAP
jgi:hypothetical protein